MRKVSAWKVVYGEGRFNNFGLVFLLYDKISKGRCGSSDVANLRFSNDALTYMHSIISRCM